MTGYSKAAQLGRPTEQEERRAGRPTRRPKARENVPVRDEDEKQLWEEAGRQALALNDEGLAKWGSRWLGVTETVGGVLYAQGLTTARIVTGRNALAVCLIARAWLEDVTAATK